MFIQTRPTVLNCYFKLSIHSADPRLLLAALGRAAIPLTRTKTEIGRRQYQLHGMCERLHARSGSPSTVPLCGSMRSIRRLSRGSRQCSRTGFARLARRRFRAKKYPGNPQSQLSRKSRQEAVVPASPGQRTGFAFQSRFDPTPFNTAFSSTFLGCASG